MAGTPDPSVLNTPPPPKIFSNRTEITKNTSDANNQAPKDVSLSNDPTQKPLQDSEQETTTEAANTLHGNGSIGNPNDGSSAVANGNSSTAPTSTTESTVTSASNALAQNPVTDKQRDLSKPMDVLDSCMSIIQPDPEGAVRDDEESTPAVMPEPLSQFLMDIEDKTIKQVPIGTPCQLETQMALGQIVNSTPNPTTTIEVVSSTSNTTTNVVQSQTVSFVSTPVQSAQSQSVTLLPTVQNVSNMYPTLNPSSTVSQLPYSSVPTYFIPTMAPNTFNYQNNFPYGIVLNSGNNWYCGNNMPNNVVMPAQNLPTITKNVPVQSMPIVNQSPIRIPHDYSPAKAFCGVSAVCTENVGNFVTIPASGKFVFLSVIFLFCTLLFEVCSEFVIKCRNKFYLKK